MFRRSSTTAIPVISSKELAVTSVLLSEIIFLPSTPIIPVQVKVIRTNIAERLYRTTGQGIYKDSILVGAAIPKTTKVV